MPCLYRETLARLLALEQFRDLIETQETDVGTTVYSDHLPAINKDASATKANCQLGESMKPLI